MLLWQLPSSFLPILLGDYLMPHFGIYGLLTFVGLRLLGDAPPAAARERRFALVIGTLSATAYAVLAVAAVVDAYVFNVQPIAVRTPLIAALCVGTLPYSLADERLTRDPVAARGAYVASKLCFLLSLVLAIALNPGRLFFLAIIVPAILLLFVVYDLFSRWALLGSGHPGVGATANALAFGCFIAAAFPLAA